MNNPEADKGAGVLERIKDFASNVGDALVPSKNQILAVGAATVAAFGASEISQNSQAEAGAPVSSESADVSSYDVQSSALALKGFKKCRRGKPVLQMRLVGSDPLERHPRDKNLYMSYVPSINTPVRQELQIKSCKNIRGVTAEVLGRKEDVHRWKKITLRANKVRKFDYDVTFPPPDPKVNNYDTPNSVGNSAKGMALKAHTMKKKGRNISIASSVGYLYTDEQMATMLSSSATGATGATSPTSP